VIVSRLVADKDIEEALAAFEASRSAKTPLGARVAAKLREFERSNDIRYDKLPGTTYGLSDEFLFGKYVKVNEAYRGDVGSTSLVLAHEGVHRLLASKSIDEEITCFSFQVDYFVELLAGVTYTSPASGAAATASTSSAVAGAPSQTDVARGWGMKDQLVDYVIAMPIYQERVTETWVKSNLSKWGGLRNRWATSLGLFAKALSGWEGNSALVLDVLEAMRTTSDWTEVQRVVGSFGRVRDVLRKSRNAPSAGSRMDALSKRWGIDWQAR